MIAHRGYSSKYYQNTEIAFRQAALNKSGGAETDIRITKDGFFVCSHNAEAVFEDGTELLVAEATLKELTAKPLRQDKTDDKYYICTFEKYLEIMKENGMVCFVELKGEFPDSKVRELFETVERVYDLKMCIMQSFCFENLIKAREMFPELPLMLTYGQGEKDWERCIEHGFSIDIDHWVVTRKIVSEFHKNGLEVAVWTVNDEYGLKFCRDLGVDYIESDIFGG